MILFTVSLIELLQNKWNLLQLVIALEKYHTNGNPEQRSKSIGIIGTVIYEVMNLGLDSKAWVALSRFFVSKLRDVHCVLQAIRAIYALIKYHSEEVKQSQNKGDECLSIIINGISSPSIHIPAYNQKVRIIAFKSYEYILNNYREFFKVQRNEEDISKEDGTNDCSNLLIPYSTIISAVLTAIESEKDPRNLIVSFELTRLILSILGNDEKYLSTIEPFLEEIFENISLYYPIEFEPPQNDKFKITSKELKDKLNRCFTSSPLLASYSFPFMLEKLSSASSVAKKESLKTLKLMVNELPIKIVRNYWEMIWNHLQNEAFNSFDEAIQTDCIEVIASLCAVLSSTKDKFITVQYDSIAEKVISEVFERWNTEIEKDPDTLTGILAFNILKAIMKKSSYLCYFVINSFMINYSLSKNFYCNCIESINETNLDSE